MKPQVARDLAYYPERARLARRGYAMVRLREDDGPNVPTHSDVRSGRATPADRLDNHRIDRTIRAFSATTRVTRAFNAARNVRHPGKGHLDWDPIEQSLGLSRTFRLEVDPDVSVVNLVADLSALDRVEMASPYYLCQAPFAVQPGRPGRGSDYAREMVGAAEALSMERGDSTLIVAIVDSGVALDHPEFTGRLRPGVDTVDLPPDQVSRGLKLYGDFQSRDRRPMDEMGHGTACASIIGARGHAMPPGLAGDALVLPMRALAGAMLSDQDEPTAVGGIPDIDLALKTAIDLGARVLNLSFGTPASALRPDDPVPHVEVVRYALARNCILVAASGNDGGKTAYFPAALPGVIGVGSVGQACKPSRFTTRHPNVAVCAPGEDVYAAHLEGYGGQNGTSFAAPFVTAACALLLARAARYSSSLSPFNVRTLLMRSATPFPAGADAAGCGAGTLNVPAALRCAEEILQRDQDDDMDFTMDDPAQLQEVGNQAARRHDSTSHNPNLARQEA